MKICQNCNIEMKLIKRRHIFEQNYFTKNGDRYLLTTSQDNLHTEIYVCPKCKILQQYIIEEDFDKLQF